MEADFFLFLIDGHMRHDLLVVYTAGMEERILHVLDLIQNLGMLSDILDSIACSPRHSQLMHKSAEKAGRTQTMKN